MHRYSLLIAAVALSASTSAYSQVSRGLKTTATVDAAGRVVPGGQGPGVAPANAPAAMAAACPADAELPPGDARQLVARIAAQENFYPEFVQSVAKIESRFVSTALSDKGAYGLMQLTGETADRFKVDRCNPEANVRGGIRFLRFLHDRYKNPFFILAAYNAGEEAVLKSRGVPPFPETVRFVADVMNDFYDSPDPSRAASTPGNRATSPDSDVIEPEAKVNPNQMAKSTGDRRWRDGFVMHID